MAKRKQPDSPIMQALSQLEEMSIRRGRYLPRPDGERLWEDVQVMVAEAGGVHHIPIEEAYSYCLHFRASYISRCRDANETLSAVHDYMSHPQAEQDTDGHRMYALYIASSALVKLDRLNEALENVLELLSERFDNRRHNWEALYYVGHIFQGLLFYSHSLTIREGVLSPGWAEAVERWAKRKKRSKTTRRWLSENPTNEELWKLVERVWLGRKELAYASRFRGERTPPKE